MMIKYLAVLVLTTVFTINAQWVQTNLSADMGRSLYTDGTTIYAATNNGVYYTNDIGDPWFSIGPENEDTYCLIKSGNKIIAGSPTGHGVFITTDNGQNWYQPPTLSNQTVYSLAKNTTYIFAGTWASGVYRSSDDGESWENIGLNSEGSWDLIVVGEELFVACPGAPSKIYYTTDNGGSWNYGTLGSPASDPRQLFYNDGKLYACDMGLWVSTNMGVSWNLQYGVTFDSTGYPVDVMMFRALAKYDQFLIASVMFESFYISSDNGSNWIPFNEGLINDWTFTGVKINGSYIWGLRDFFGNAYRRPVSELVTDVRKSNEVLLDFKLEQNYPNPFNPKTNIGFRIAKNGFITLKIYDVLGNEIATLVDEYKPVGTYEVEFSAKEGYTSGVYFYKLTTDSFSETKKLLLLK